MNIFGKIGESNSSSGTIDTSDLLKVLRMALMVAISAGIGFVAKSIVGLDLIPNSTVDEVVITSVIIPVLELLRRYFTNYQTVDNSS